MNVKVGKWGLSGSDSLRFAQLLTFHLLPQPALLAAVAGALAVVLGACGYPSVLVLVAGCIWFSILAVDAVKAFAAKLNFHSNFESNQYSD